MKISLPGTKIRFLLPLCLLSAIFSFVKPAACQDLSSTRFFNFSIQSLSASTTPVVPQAALMELTPQTTRPSFLYEFSLRFPIKMHGKTRLFGEIGHKNEFFSGIYTFDPEESAEFEALELFQTSGSLILLHQFNERWKMLNVLKVHSRSDQTFDFGQQALGYSYVAMLEKKVPKGKLGFGGLVSVNQRISVLPIFKYEASLGKGWGVDLLLPSRALITKDFSRRTRLLFGVEGDAATYFLNGSEGLEGPLVGSNFRRMSINGIVGVERQLSPMLGIRAEVGTSLPFQCGVFDLNQTNLGLHDFQNQVSPHFKVGFFLSLPR